MNLPELCIRRPVLSAVLSLILILLGAFSYDRLAIRFFPKMNLPMVTVHTRYAGADAQTIETDITTRLESAIADIDGVQSLSSRSHGDDSDITIMFKPGGDFEQQASQVRDKVAAQRQYLPADIDDPVVTAGTTGSEILFVGFSDKNKTSSETRDYVLHSIDPLLRSIPGVGSIGLVGGGNYAMRIWLHPDRMAALGVTVTDINTALTNNNISFPSGSIRGEQRFYSIRSDTRLKNASQFKQIIIRVQNNAVIRMGDVADVEVGFTSLNPTPAYVNSTQGVVLTAKALRSANPITVAKALRAKLAEIKETLPEGMELNVMYDESHFLTRSLDETVKAILYAVGLVVIVVLLFLGSMRAASVPIVTIPVSLIATLFLIYLMGFSVNVLSLLAIVLAIGLVVDDAIVMLENIHRFIERGHTPLDAAIKGSKEITSAVIAMSLTLAAVYAPVGFAQGFTAILFQEFAFTLAGAVLISGFVALTLSPMMCSKLLPQEHRPNRYEQRLQRCFECLTRGYHHVLRFFLSIRFLVVLLMFVVAGLGYWLVRSLPSEFLPAEDYGYLSIWAHTPSGSTVEYIDKYTAEARDLIVKEPAVEDFAYQVRAHSWAVFTTLKPWGKRHQTSFEVVKKLAPQLATIPGVSIRIANPNPVSVGSTSDNLQVNLMTAGNYTDLLESVSRLETALKNNPGLMAVDTDFKYNSQQFLISVNRDLAAELGVNVKDIGDTLHATMSGIHWTDVFSGETSYPVDVQLPPDTMRDLSVFDRLYVLAASPLPATAVPASTAPVTNPIGSNMIPLSALVSITPHIGHGALLHFNRLRSAQVTAMPVTGYTMSQAIDYVNQHIKSTLSSGVSYAFSGAAAQLLRSSGQLGIILGMALLFIYLILAAQFGSFIDPLIILIAVPLSLVGALFFLKCIGGTLNLYSQIGLVTLVGLVSKHGILITEFINKKRAQGMELKQAIIEGASIRFRPILMTTMAMVIGTLPLAFATGPGSNGRHQIGWVIAGGLLLGTFFSLVVVPVVYSYLGRFKKITVDNELGV